jgi:hypothetical protein
MSKHPLVMLRALPEELKSLAELALDLRWTWVNNSDRLWKMLDPDIWGQTRNGFVSRSSCPVAPYFFVSGSCRSGGPRYTCWTATTSSTARSTEVLRVNSTTLGPNSV